MILNFLLKIQKIVKIELHFSRKDLLTIYKLPNLRYILYLKIEMIFFKRKRNF